jgi:hypothetical protein
MESRCVGGGGSVNDYFYFYFKAERNGRSLSLTGLLLLEPS